MPMGTICSDIQVLRGKDNHIGMNLEKVVLCNFFKVEGNTHRPICLLFLSVSI